MLKRIATAIWGKFDSVEEVKKFAYLALIFFLIIGTYWSLRPMKDSIFNAVVGSRQWLWLAKIISLCVISPLIIVYGKMIDRFPRQKVFYILASVYTVLTLGFAWAFAHPGIGLENTMQDPSRVIGWAWYVFVESYGSLIVALFWAFTADTTTTDSAKRGFPVIALFGQLGNILGPTIMNTRTLGFANSAPIVAMCAGLIAATGVLFWWFIQVTPAAQLVGYQQNRKVEEKKEEPSFFEGLRLLLTKSYLLGIFLIISFYEVIVTVIDIHFKITTFEVFPSEGASQAFLSDYARYVGYVATVCVLLGINNIQRRLGMRASLVLLPFLVATAVTTVYMNPHALNIAMWIMVFSKAINYALNQPTLKQLYIPTSVDTRYKAQAWIEMFGSRGSKAVGSFWSGFRNVVGLNPFMFVTLVTSLGVVGCWIFVATYVSKMYNEAVENDEVVC